MRRQFVLLFIACCTLPAAAEPLPQPAVEFMAKGTLAGRGDLTMRHKEGKLRMDMSVSGAPVSMSGIIDVAARKALMIMPLATKTAIEIEFGSDANLGHMVGDGKMTGSAMVAGEKCNLWEVNAPKAQGPAIVCITADGIGLRTEVLANGQRHTIMEITELSRGRQDPELFSLPPDTKIIKPPSNLKDLIRGAAPNQ